MKRVLIITDEKKSSKNQCDAILNHLKKKKKLQIEYDQITRKFFHYLPNPFIYLFLKTFKTINKNYDVIISCGRISAPYSLILKNKNPNCKNIHILDPYFLREKFDKILIPHHDISKLPKLSNIIKITGTLAYLKKFPKSETKKFSKISSSKKIVSCLIGGDGRSSKFLNKDVDSLLKKINLLSNNYKVIYCFSRRTSKMVKKMIFERKKKHHLCFDYTDFNPYWYLINKSDYFVVTEDSVSMISDTITTGKPVYIMEVSILKQKIKEFVKFLKLKGVVRNFNGKVSSWNYLNINESLRISKIIETLF